ncbi:MAG TPA: antibiotic biosynthesis monooxygenase [Ktedonobacterales bacterium]
MAYAAIRIKAADFEGWKRNFEGMTEVRRANGSHGGMVFRNPTDSEEFILLVDWENLETGRRLVQSPEVQEKMRAVGVSLYQPYVASDTFDA